MNIKQSNKPEDDKGRGINSVGEEIEQGRPP